MKIYTLLNTSRILFMEMNISNRILPYVMKTYVKTGIKGKGYRILKGEYGIIILLRSDCIRSIHTSKCIIDDELFFCSFSHADDSVKEFDYCSKTYFCRTRNEIVKKRLRIKLGSNYDNAWL
jgi:hypothetical protein